LPIAGDWAGLHVAGEVLIMMKLVLTLLIFAAFPARGFALDLRLQVRHDHLVKECRGELVFTDQAVEYRTPNAKHARVWKYEDIQQLGLVSPREVVVLTFEDRAVELGRDRRFRFELTAGEVPAWLPASLQPLLTRPLVSGFVPADWRPLYRVPVRRRGFWRGSQGMLEIAEDYIVYRTSDQNQSRVWKVDDILYIGSTGPFELRVSALERTGGQAGGARNFVFDLKQRLDPKAYDLLWDRINRPQR
jgi:hypothetical protein